MNVGEARGVFRLDGLKEAIKDLHQVKTRLEVLNNKLANNQSAQNAVLRSLQSHRTVNASIVSGQKSLQGVLAGVNKQLQIQASLYKNIKAASTRLNTTVHNANNIRSAFNMWNRETEAKLAQKKIDNQLLTIDAKRAYDAVKHSRSRFSAWTKEAEAKQKQLSLDKQIANEDRKRAISASINSLAQERSRIWAERNQARKITNTGAASPLPTAATSAFNLPAPASVSRWQSFSTGFAKGATGVHNLNNAMSKLTETSKRYFESSNNWFSRFGAVAAGFWIAYRAINALEFAISNITRTFARGLVVIDEYVESVAESAGMLALLSQGGTFVDRYSRAKEHMNTVMDEFIRLGPKYRVTMEGINNGVKELAQFGVVVNRSDVDSTLNLFALIEKVATTTGSSARQVRQEIQALFSDQARTTDQFARMVKFHMPELYKQVLDLQKAGGGATDKWKLLIKGAEGFKIAVEDSNKTIRAQTQIMQANLSIISSKAFATSGIFQKWLGPLSDINKRLFDAHGNLGDLGIRVYEVFYRIWQILDRIILTVLAVAKFAWGLITVFRAMPTEVHKVAFFWLKVAGAILLIKATLGIITSLVKVLGIGMLIKGISRFSILIADVVMKLLRSLPLIAAKVGVIAKAAWAFLAPILIVVAKVALILATFAAAYTLTRGLVSAFTSVGYAVRDTLYYWIDLSGAQLRKFFEFIKHPFDPSAREVIELPIKPEPIDWAETLKDAKYYLVEGMKTGFEEIKEFVTTGVDYVSNAAKNMMGKVKELISKMMPEGSEGVGKVGKTLGEATAGFGSAMDQFIKDWENITSSFGKVNPFKLPPATADVKLNFPSGGEEKIKEKIRTIADYLSDTFSTYFTDVFMGEIKSVEDALTGLLKSIQKAFAQIMADYTSQWFKSWMQNAGGKLGEFLGTQVAFKGAGGGLASAGGGGGSLGDMGFGGAAANQFARGGIVTEPVFGLGLDSGETYSFAETGPERVLNNDQSFSAPVCNVQIVMDNQSSAQLKAEQKGQRFDGEKYILNVVMKDLVSNGQLAKVLRSPR